MDKIIVRGARTHNLKNIDIEIPRNKLVVITGLSGSGKSSLAFDTLYAEGQRRYVESLSTYARQFLSLMEKPDVDHIEGLSPAIAIEQKSTSHNPRSTVGTVTEIYDYLRLLYSRVGQPHCPTHGTKLEAQSISQMVDQILNLPEGSKIMLLAPIITDKKGGHRSTLEELAAQGYIRARIDGTITDLDQLPNLRKSQKHTIEVVIDRFKVRQDIKTRLADSLETTLNLSDGIAIATSLDKSSNIEHLFSTRYSCTKCGHNLPELEPRLFSFNNPNGACTTCDGLGSHRIFDANLIVANQDISIAEGAIRGWDRRNSYYFQMLSSLAAHYQFDIEQPYRLLSVAAHHAILHGSDGIEISFNYLNDRGDTIARKHPFEGIIPIMERRYRETESQAVREDLGTYISHTTCGECKGSRINENARHVLINGKPLPEITQYSIKQTLEYFCAIRLDGARRKIGEQIIKEVMSRLRFLVNVGLEYLSLHRSAGSLSGGEAQRIRLASQIGAGLVGVMYILDEPSIGLHQRDNERLLETLMHLRDMGNTVIVVEHDEETIREADYIIDIGPGAGVHGGQIISEGNLRDIIKCQKSITGHFLSGKRKISLPSKLYSFNNKRVLSIISASGNNLKEVDLHIPIGLFTCITGVSGSGKSTLINQTLHPIVTNSIYGNNQKTAPYKSYSGTQHFDKVVDIDQNPIGRTPRSNPATYTGMFTAIRELFSGTAEARSRGYKPGRFSFNIKGGRCEACQGGGLIKVEMHFLPDIYVPCDTCNGKRYNRETLDINYKGKNINQVLEMTVENAYEFFSAIPVITKKLCSLIDVGLSYITLGQPATTLSGGEAQRVKISKELSKRDTGRTLYILDEPTTGLHFHDINQLLAVLFRLRDQGNTVIVIEHNLDVIKTADWVIDLGPEGGLNGGQIVAQDTPTNIASIIESHTGRYLAPLLNQKP
ncbi:MAG: excinuclease ABC subunit UvrA [Pseudomonadales bacterium]|nr:excinuclease ABC subunit UvrA [Pseudomonadales bacterium]